MEDLRKTRRKTIGTKQTLKAVQKDSALVVFIAREAEARVTESLLRLCDQKGVQVVQVDSMAELGRACGIEVGSAAAAIIKEDA